MARTVDFVVVGAGIVGLATARELQCRFPEARIAIFEKENGLGKHASGRNSGVLHSGIYYAAGTWKARVCAEGRKAMAEYCQQYGLPIDRVGKVILPVRDGDDAQLELLMSRATANGVHAEMIDEGRLQELEPHARTRTGKALFVPDAFVVDPKAILQQIADELIKNGAELHFGSTIHSFQPDNSALTVNGETFGYGHLFSAAGAHADRIAKLFGIASNYTILPFKGIYFRLSQESGIEIRHLIYSVPDLRVPFLGVHFAKSVNGDTFLGPTVIPAFGRENYSLFTGLSVFDTGAILLRLAQQYFSNHQGFRRLVHQEGKRFIRHYFADAVRALTPSVRDEHLIPSDKVGIRAQLLDLNKRELVMDFVIEEAHHSTHVLNAVSPAFTSSFAFARHVVDSGL